MIVLLARHKMGRTAIKAIAEKMQHDIIPLTNYDPWPNNSVDLVFRWGCTSNIFCRNAVNTAKAIHLVNDKAKFRQLLDQQKLCPKTWFDCSEELRYPVIVRPNNHFQGRKLYYCTNLAETLAIQDYLREAGREIYISEYIPKVVEYRVFVAQGRIAFMYEKVVEDKTQIAWNHSEGSKAVNVRWGDWPRDVCEKAIAAFNLSGLDFGAVDVIVDAAGTAYVLEINSAPAMTSEYWTSCIAKCFDYIIENGKTHIPVNTVATSWRRYIHPAISEEAIIGVEPV